MDDRKNTAEVILTPEAIELAKNSKEPSFKINNIIAGVFALLFLIMLFIPVTPCGRGCSNGLQATDLFFWPMMIFGVVGACSFGARMFKLTKNSSTAVKVLGNIIGIFGGLFIALIAFMASIMGYFRGHPINS